MARRAALRLSTILLLVAAAPTTLVAGADTKAVRIGILTLSTATWGPNAEGFRQALREHGYSEGRNAVLEHRDAAGKAERLPALARELVRLKVDVIVTQSNVATLAAKEATLTIPIVMAIAGDPLSSGLVGSLAHPGGNVTGLSLMQTDLNAKRLTLLKEAIPGIAVVAVVWNPDDPSADLSLHETESAAKSLGLQLRAVEARSSDGLGGALDHVATLHPSAFYTLPGGMFQSNVQRIVEFARMHNLPGIFPNREFAEAGGLMSYAPSLSAQWRRSAFFVDRILRGASPADIPIEQPTKLELVVNVKTARALHLTVPASLLARADEVID